MYNHNNSPTIHVNVRTVRSEHEDPDAERQRLWSEYQDQEATAASNDGHGSAVYDLSSSTTTMEYDVVACESFVEDKGCWIRNMPDEIKAANPQFVPS